MFVAITTVCGGGVAELGLDACRVVAVHPAHADALDDRRAVGARVRGERVDQRHRVDLDLVVEAHRTGDRERQRRLVHPGRLLDPGPVQGVELGAHRADAGLAVGEGVRRAVLVLDAVVVAEPGDPRLALGVRLGVLAQHRGRVPARDPRVVGALEQADLGGAAAGRAGADVAGLEHQHRLPGAGEQAGGGQPGDAGTDDHDVPVADDVPAVRRPGGDGGRSRAR